MDFRRIEWIFLVVFIALDIFLAVSYSQNNNNIVITEDPGTSTSDTILQDMRDDNITVGSLSTKQGEGYYLSTQNEDELRTHLDRLVGQTYSYNAMTHTLTSKFTTVLSYDQEKMVAELKSFVKDENNVIFGKEYTYEAALSDPKKDIVFVQKSTHGVILDTQAELIFKISGNNVTGYTQTYISDLTVLREKQTAISAFEAVQLLYISSEIPQNSKIVWYKLGYSELIDVRGSVIYVPVWNIMIEHKDTKNESLKKVNAFSSTVIKNQTTSTSTTSSSTTSSSSSVVTSSADSSNSSVQ
ncbi:two-component system regulatory protein YycI [Lapidilactobacillus mulanensis]|uniref:Two-component system regulatory protein YycI n=1 Tax=Lapidilactobacillus mulanensis TaxID=2485999 RepID=A0ABW4DN42_9LACO|nr:two-component system regulatory protein YycI [Lapidilactobacillus mulanensis]